jgi:polysaccharide deacetylase family protein (PEP-CTERM system associated)
MSKGLLRGILASREGRGFLEKGTAGAVSQRAMFVFSSGGQNTALDPETPNALTVDVEEEYQVSGFESRIDRQRWSEYPSRVEANTERLLVLLRRRQVRATFFVLGWTAQQCPDLIRRIQNEGHEIGAHSFWHQCIYRQSPEAFREDLVRTKELLRGLTGQEILSYRAPSFSITRRSWWALEILAEEGFRYDSSVFPIRHDRYGAPDSPVGIYRVQTPSGPIWEFPPAVCRLAGINVPCAGGGYFRLYPLWLTMWLLRAIRREGRPFVFYVHPWELDPRQPRLPGSLLSRFRHYWNLAVTARRLEALLDQFPFAPLGEVMEEYLAGRGESGQAPGPNRPTETPSRLSPPTQGGS